MITFFIQNMVIPNTACSPPCAPSPLPLDLAVALAVALALELAHAHALNVGVAHL